MEYYKKIDKSVFHYGITIQKKHVGLFTNNDPIEPGGCREVTLWWKAKKKKYNAVLVHVNRKKAASVYQIRWDNNNEFLLQLKKEFIQSYLAIESKNYEATMKGKYFVTDLLGGNQEVLIFRPIGKNDIEIETFIKIPTPYDNIFKRLVEENVFGWLSNPTTDYLVTKSTKWHDKKELKKHQDAKYVIYYLIDEEHKEIYIGSAMRLGDRIKEGRDEIPGWNKFKYEILHPQYHHLLRRIEFYAIRSFAGFLQNKAGDSELMISDYKLVNKSWSKRR